MTEQERKFANELHYAVKGHLINPNYSNEEVMAIYDSYFTRLWGNHERLVYCKEHFEQAWRHRQNGNLENSSTQRA